MIPAEAVWRAGCLECDWRYYTLIESRAVNWAEAHSEEEGHGVKVAVLEGGKMTNQVIPAEAVDAAARGLARHKWPTAIGAWESFGQGMQDDFRDQARAALKAAAPYLRAGALEDAADGLPFLDRPKNMLVRQQDAAAWLRARAAAERGGE